MNPVRFLAALAFAADKHRSQKRKGIDASPYINHPIAVAEILAHDGGISDETLLMGAVLHDTVEDTETTYQELAENFGSAVADLVMEVTDDKSLPQAERKQLQIRHAAAASAAARQLKIADKLANIRDLSVNPPEGWSQERLSNYVTWAEQVVAGCRGLNPGLDAAFDAGVARARAALAEGE